jgi:hypothetical protein
MQKDCVYYIFTAPRNSLNRPDTFSYMCGALWPSNLIGEILPHSWRNCYELHFGCKVGDKDTSWAPHICCVKCEASHKMNKWFAPKAIRLSNGLEETKRPIIQLLRLFNKHYRDHLQIHTHNEISTSAIYNEACPSQRREEIWLVAMTTLILINITDSMKGPMLNAIWHLKKVVTHLNHVH